jgi:hypothetical protein
MYGDRTAQVIRLQDYPNGVAAGLRTRLCAGRHEIVSVGKDPSLALIGGDPFNTTVYTGLQVPAMPTALLPAVPGVPQSQRRYLFLLAREQFSSGEQGVRLTGIRLYAELVAVFPPSESRPTGAIFHREIIHPLFRPPDGSITWHVMIIPKTQMARRNIANDDSFIFRDSYGPALLFEQPFPAYVPPNGGRPWGSPIGASLGNMHDLRYRWRYSDIEQTLDIPVPLPCDVALFASVRQNDPSTNPTDTGLTANQFAALEHEGKFLTAFHSVAQYGRIAGSLVFNENLGENVP